MRIRREAMNKFINADIKYPCSPVTESKGFSRLMWLVIHLDDFSEFLPRIKHIIAHSTPSQLDYQNDNGWTVLMILSRSTKRKYYVELLELLIRAGAGLDFQTSDGWTALMCASRYSNIDSTERTVELLIRAGADIGNVDKSLIIKSLNMIRRYDILLKNKFIMWSMQRQQIPTELKILVYNYTLI